MIIAENDCTGLILLLFAAWAAKKATGKNLRAVMRETLREIF